MQFITVCVLSVLSFPWSTGRVVATFVQANWDRLLLCLLAIGHLSSSSIYPVCLAPYLIVTTCSDTRVRFWHCAVEGMEGNYEDDQDNRVYHWQPWALLNEEEDNNSAVCMPGRPVAVSCSYIGRLAVAFKQPRQGQVGSSNLFL